MLEEAAFNSHWFAASLSKRIAASAEQVAGAAAGGVESLLESDPLRAGFLIRRRTSVYPGNGAPPMPQPVAPAVKVGDVALFVGQITDLSEVKGNTFALVRVYGLKQYLVVGVRGAAQAPKRSYRFVAGVVTDASQAVPCVVAAGLFELHDVDPRFCPSTPPPRGEQRPVDREAALQQKLTLARMYVVNGLNAKAIEVCRRIVKDAPGSDAAAKAKEMLRSLGAEE